MNTLKEMPSKITTASSATRALAQAPAPSAEPVRVITDLEKQAEDLENRARELRKRIEALKPEGR